jgi:hypothetical protein
MSTNEAKKSNLPCYMGLVLGVALVYMALSNVITWKANVINAGNMQRSFIGRTIQQLLSDSYHSQEVNNFSLAQTDIASRIAVPAKTEPYFNIPLVTDSMAMGSVDEINKVNNVWTLRGWTYVPEGAGSPEFVIAVENEKIVGVLTVAAQRPDVAKALNAPKALRTGYSGQVASQANAASCQLLLYTLTSSLKLFAMPSVCEKFSNSAQ